MAGLPYMSRWYGKREQDDRFDKELLEHVVISPNPRGNIQVACRFRFNKSQWGIFTDARHDPRPGGVIYLDLDFHQPGDGRLKFATVKLTLDDKDDDLPPPGQVIEAPVRVNISHHGPAHLFGRPIEVPKTTLHHASPWLEIQGLGFGGVGTESEQLFIKETRWEFNSKLGSANKRRQLATNQLVWEFKENPLAAQAVHSNTIHTAFAFAHSGQPFFIKVEVGGRFSSRMSHTREFVNQSFSSNKHEDSFATTLVNFGNVARFQMPLNELAEKLPIEMVWKNIVSIPWELSDTQKPSHEDLKEDEPNPAGTSTQDQIEGIANDASDTAMRSAHARAYGPFIKQSDLQQFTGVTNHLVQAPPSRTSTVSVLESAVKSSPSRPVKRSGGREDVQSVTNVPLTDHAGTSSASDVTAVDYTPPPPLPSLQETTDAAEAKEWGGVEQEMVVEFLQMCGVLAVTRAFLNLLAYCGMFVGPRRDSPSIAAKKVCIDEELRPEGRTAARPGRKRTRTPVESMSSG